MKSTHRCPEVLIDLLIMNQIEDFADYLPEGVTLKPSGTFDARMTVRHGCLCGIDMAATATSNGYRCEDQGDSRFSFILLDDRTTPIAWSGNPPGTL